MEILTKLGAPPDIIEEVCDIVGHHHHPRPEETLNFKVVYDADQIANLEERHKETPMNEADLQSHINLNILTDTGRKVAEQVLFTAG